MNLDDSTILEEITKLISVIVLWTAGYIAAPVVFMATLGVFRNLAGMGTGVFKGLSGRIRAPGKEARSIGQSPRKQAKQMKRESIAWGRANRGRQRRQQLGDTLSARKDDGSVDWEATKTRGSKLGKDLLSEPRAINERRRARGELKTALYETAAQQKDPSVEAGHLTQKAAQIQASAGAINAEKIYAEEFNARTNAGEPSSGDLGARNKALEAVANNLVEKMNNGSATQSEVTGTLTFLGQQKNAKGLSTVQESIARIENSENQRQAIQQYSAALGNGSAYAAMTKVNPGYKHVPDQGESVKSVSNQRRNTALGDAPEKLADATNAVWKDIIENGSSEQRQKAAGIAANVQRMGGEASLKLDLPAAPKPDSPAAKDYKKDYKEFYAAFENAGGQR